MSSLRVHVLRSGTVRPPLRRGPLSPRADLPVWCFLIEHPAQGLILVDTGLGQQPLPAHLQRYYRPEPFPTAAQRLSALGIRPEELSAVLLSDLDIDHTGGIRDLRGARRFLVSEEEYYWTGRTVFARRQPRALWENDIRFEAYYVRAAAWAPAQHALDLFGDGSVVSVLTPGHTFGNCTTMLTWNGSRLLLAGNAVRRGRTLEDDTVYHHFRQDKTVAWLRETSAAPDCLGVFATHDPDLSETVLEL